MSDKTDKLILKGSYKMLLRKKFYLQIEYHWYCINLLKKQLNDSNETHKQKINGKINYDKQRALSLSLQYETLIGLRNENGMFC
jgi:hypothetical protein